MDLTATPGYVAGFPLEMGVRELGGLRAADGRVVRHGLLYRGAVLTNLTPKQCELIDGMGLRLVFDLRSEAEAQGNADYVPEGAEYVRIAGMYDASGEEVDFSPAGIVRLNEQLDDPSQLMPTLYAGMAHNNPALHALVERFVAGKAPLYMHCTAGKDRTGVCAAMLLSLLGVPDKTIVGEFLLTNEYRASIINNPPAKLPSWVPASDLSVWREANGVSAANLKTLFATADGSCFSREEYFAMEFGLDASALETLRNRYLT